MVPYLHAYRSCSLYQKCVDSEEGSRPFAYSDAEEAFMAHCLPLEAILDHAGLAGKTIDVLSVDIEKGETAVFKNFPFSKYNIRYVVTEVGRWAAWLETDTYFLASGYAKVAILGRDVVYAKLSELGPPLAEGNKEWEPEIRLQHGAELPAKYWDFQTKVIDDEQKWEMTMHKATDDALLRMSLAEAEAQ
jgi:hypothetical protein